MTEITQVNILLVLSSRLPPQRTSDNSVKKCEAIFAKVGDVISHLKPSLVGLFCHVRKPFLCASRVPPAYPCPITSLACTHDELLCHHPAAEYEFETTSPSTLLHLTFKFEGSLMAEPAVKKARTYA
jgi:hypothetical protein